MTNYFIWNIEKKIIVLLVIVEILFEAFNWNFDIFISLLLLTVTLIVGFYLSYVKESIMGHFLSVYALLIGPINIMIGSLTPDVLVSGRLLEVNVSTLFSNMNTTLKYSVYLCLFYIVIMMTLQFGLKLVFNTRGILTPEFLNIKHPIVIAVFVSAIEYYLRTKYYLNVPGHNPLIPGAGYIIYFFESIDFYLLFLILFNEILDKRKASALNFIRTIVGIIATNFAGIMIGERGPIMRVFVIVLFIIIIRYFDRANDDISIKERKKATRVIFIFGLAAVIGLGVTNLARTGKFYAIGFLLQRITGLYDGLIALSHFEGKKFPLTLGNYFKTLVTGSGVTANSYYTHSILGYPTTAIHGSAVPIFISAWMYGGILGIIVIAFVEGALLSIADKGFKRSVYNLGSIQENTMLIYGKLYCFLLFSMVIISSHILDGDITTIKPIVVSILTYFLIKCTTYKSF